MTQSFKLSVSGLTNRARSCGDGTDHALSGRTQVGRIAVRKRQTHHPFGLAVAVKWGHIERGNAGVVGFAHGCDGFFPTGLTPHLADSATTQGIGADLKQLSERVVLHISPQNL